PRIDVIFYVIRPPPGSTLFPYTTLFRSILEPQFGTDRLGQRERDRQAQATALAARVAGQLREAREHPLALRMRNAGALVLDQDQDRKSTRLNSSHVEISYAVFCLKKKND